MDVLKTLVLGLRACVCVGGGGVGQGEEASKFFFFSEPSHVVEVQQDEK